jgi:hypothetical protein
LDEGRWRRVHQRQAAWGQQNVANCQETRTQGGSSNAGSGANWSRGLSAAARRSRHCRRGYADKSGMMGPNCGTNRLSRSHSDPLRKAGDFPRNLLPRPEGRVQAKTGSETKRGREFTGVRHFLSPSSPSARHMWGGVLRRQPPCDHKSDGFVQVAFSFAAPPNRLRADAISSSGSSLKPCCLAAATWSSWRCSGKSLSA